jgi:GT2 family glycosyltransferase
MTEGSAIAGRAPAVVVLLVTREPGPWFEETLEGLAAQDYENLSVLVLVSGGKDPTARVGAVLPDAFVRLLPADRGFGAAVEEGLAMVEGGSFFLLCHDDCALAPDAVHLMVEESFRSNAGIVSPKMVHWDDPRALLHLGQNVDRMGAVVERVQDGEIDAGQHDAVRDVFVAPGGCTLVRADLLRALGGYDPAITAMGEDLDLSWRALLAGARIVVEPAARARHLELVAGGCREPVPSGAPSLRALQRRHELLAVLSCYSWLQLALVLPQAAALAAGEMLVAAVAGDRRRARDIAHAWRWNAAHLGLVHRRRVAVKASRAVPDAEIRSLQLGRSARLSTYLARLTHQGVEAAHGLPPGRERGSGGAPAGVAGERGGETLHPEPALTGTIGAAFSEDADFDDLDDLGRRGRRHGRRAVLGTPRARIVAWLVVTLLLVVGSRGLIGVSWPLIGQYLPFPTWTSVWHAFFASSQPAGVGSGNPAGPAFGFLGVLGTVLFGRMGLLQEVLVLGCVPLGAWGMSRLLGPFASPRGRFAGTFAYLALPLAYDALARGRWDGLVAYAATPWIMTQLAVSTGLEPFGSQPTGGTGASGEAGAGESAGWRHRLPGRILVLGALEAVSVAFAPAMALVVLLAGIAIALGTLLTGRLRQGLRAVVAAAGATVVAAVLCLPWAVATLAAGRRSLSVLGLAGLPRTMPGWGGLLRLAVGPVGGSPLAWFLPAVALAPLLVCRGPRLSWAVRMWAVALLAWFVALVAAKAWAVPFAPSIDVVLAPAAVGVAVAVGLAVAGFEQDLAGYRFGWRQGVAVLSVAAIAAGALPVAAEAANGRWGLPTAGYAQAAGLPQVHRPSSGYRVLWLGDPQVLPLGGWSIGPGLAYATSTDGTPDLRLLWPPASPGRAASLASDVQLAMRGETVRLGRLLAAGHVRYVVVVDALAPGTPGTAEPSYPVPRGFVTALARQEDLRTVPVSVAGLTVFEDTAGATGHATSTGGSGASGVLDPLGASLELLLWLSVAVALLGGRRVMRLLPLRRRKTGARHRRRSTAAAVAAAPTVEAMAEPGLPSGTLSWAVGEAPAPPGAADHARRGPDGADPDSAAIPTDPPAEADTAVPSSVVPGAPAGGRA